MLVDACWDGFPGFRHLGVRAGYVTLWHPASSMTDEGRRADLMRFF
jgi:hypothetical protein